MLTLDGTDERTGDVDFGSCLSLVILASDESVALDDGPTVILPSGAYLVECVSSGAVYAWREDDESSARATFDALDARYEAWLNADDSDLDACVAAVRADMAEDGATDPDPYVTDEAASMYGVTRADVLAALA